MSIRAGIVGYGLAGRVFHAPFLDANAAFELAMISTSDPERASAASGDHPGTAVVSTPDELLAAGLDLIVLASPPHVHREQAVAALEAGAAVVIDKPFVPTTDDADAIIAASERAGKPVFVFQNRRWDADFLTARRLLAEGALGDVLRFESSFERWGELKTGRWQARIPVAEGGGILFDLGSHLIDQALQLFGPATVTAAELRTVHPGGESDDDAFVSLRHQGGVRSHLTMSRVARATGPRLRILGTKGAFTSYGLDPQEDAIRSGGANPLDADFGVVPEGSWGLLSPGEQPVPSERGAYSAFYEGVAAVLISGAPSPVDVSDSRAVVEIIEAAHRLS